MTTVGDSTDFGCRGWRPEGRRYKSQKKKWRTVVRHFFFAKTLK